jgi:glutamate synthase domain-containing protein 1
MRMRREIYTKETCACSIFGAMDRSGDRFIGADVVKAIANMHIRGNGLGGGFAAYGIYPDYEGYYAFHVMFDGASPEAMKESKGEFDLVLNRDFDVVNDEEIPHCEEANVQKPPLVWRYFVSPNKKGVEACLSDDDYVVQKVMDVNTKMNRRACFFSSGKNMGVFKGVGFPEDVADYFMLHDSYRGYIWTSHGRFPTNTQAWWGGAHPFSLLDCTVVHNGEISSYGTNKWYLEMYGYSCNLMTDTEVIAYAVDLLMRRQGIPVDILAKVFSPPIWTVIDRMEPEKKKLFSTLRMVYGPLLMNGPFSIVIGHKDSMIGLTDRIRLRPLTAGTKGDMLYLSSEEAAIRLISPGLDRVWTPNGGEPVVGQLKTNRVVRDEVVSVS